MRVTDSDSCICLFYEQFCHRFSDDVGSSEDDNVLSVELWIVFEYLH